jgi:hypothetical protein
MDFSLPPRLLASMFDAHATRAWFADVFRVHVDVCHPLALDAVVIEAVTVPKWHLFRFIHSERQRLWFLWFIHLVIGVPQFATRIGMMT